MLGSRIEWSMLSTMGTDTEPDYLLNVRETETGCWEWKGSVAVNGYPRYSGRAVHREVWKQSHRLPIPPGLVIAHRCDNPPCIRPDHLFLATQGGNVYDMHSKGRQGGGTLKGSQVPTHKLTEAQVLELRRLRQSEALSYHELGRRFGVSRRTAGLIVERKAWKHVA